MKRSRLRKRVLKKKGQEIRMLYKGQRNYCGSRLRKTKSRYYTNRNENKILK